MTDSELAERIGEIYAITKSNGRKLHRINETLHGNGKDGLVVRVDRVEQREKVRSRLMWSVIGVALAAMATVIGGWIGGWK